MKIHLRRTLIVRQTVWWVLLVMVIGSCSPSIMSDQAGDDSNNRQDWRAIEKEGESFEYSIYEDRDRYAVKLKTRSKNVQARILAFGLTVKIGGEKKNQTIVNYPIGFFEERYFSTPQQLFTFWEETKTIEICKARLNRIKNIAYIRGLNGQEGYVMKDSISQVDLSYLFGNTEFIYELNIPKEKFSQQEFASIIGIEIGRLEVGRHYPNARFLELGLDNNYPDHLSKLSFKWEIWITGYEGALVL